MTNCESEHSSCTKPLSILCHENAYPQSTLMHCAHLIKVNTIIFIFMFILISCVFARDPGYIEVATSVYQEYVVHLRPLYTQADKYELLKKMTLEADEYSFSAYQVKCILYVWREWIHDKPDTYNTLTKHQKKNWKNREDKMEALLRVMEAKHVQRQE